jgi:hypothetical protein
MRTKILVSLLTLMASLWSDSLSAQTTNGLQLWLKPEGITNTVATSPISFWTDSSAGGYSATNPAAGRQPTLVPGALNGYPVAHFTGDGVGAANNFLQSPMPYNASTNPFTAIVVYRSQFVGTRNTLIHQISGNPMLYVAAGGGNTNLISNASYQFISNSVSYVPDTWEIASLVEDATSLSLYKDGVLMGSTVVNYANAVAATSGGGFVFGARQNKTAFGLNGDIAEILIYTNALTDIDRAATENYLAAKYNMTTPTFTTLLSDNFNTVADPAGQNDDLTTRQAGLVATKSYYSGGGPVDIVGSRLNFNNASPLPGYEFFYATPDWNLLPYEGGSVIQIRFDIKDLAGAYTANANDSWASFTLSQYPDGGGGPVTDWGFLLRTNGTGATINWPGGALSFGGFAVTPTNHYSVQLNIVNGTVGLVINDVPCGGGPILCPLGSGVRRMFFGLGQNNNGAVSATFDNLVVTRSLLPGAVPAATLQLADNFNSTDAADINADIARQTGPAAPSAWYTNGNVNSVLSISGSALLMTNSPAGATAIGMASSTRDFRPLEHLNSFRISYTVSGGNDATSNDSWTAIRFRDDAPFRFVADADGGGTGMNFFTADGRWFLWQSILGPTNTASTVTWGTVPVSPSYDFVYEVINNVLQVKINGLQLPLGCGGAGHPITASQLANYITLHCLANSAVTAGYAAFDNFKFEALDPGFTVSAPTIVNPAQIGSDFRFSVNSVTNIFYAVDSKTDLNAPAWNYLGGFLGNGGLANYTNNPATNAQQFYQVRVP